MMDHDIREAVLHLDPLRSVVKTELIQRDGTCIVKHIPGDALVDELKSHTHIAPMHTGLLPPGIVALTAYRDGWDVTLENVTDQLHGLLPQNRVSGLPAAAPAAAMQGEKRCAERLSSGGC